MKNDLLIFFAALVVLGVTFATYLDWLLTQPRPVVAEVKVPLPSPHAHLKPDMR